MRDPMLKRIPRELKHDSGIESADQGVITIDGDELGYFSEKKLTEYRRPRLSYIQGYPPAYR